MMGFSTHTLGPRLTLAVEGLFPSPDYFMFLAAFSTLFGVLCRKNDSSKTSLSKKALFEIVPQKKIDFFKARLTFLKIFVQRIKKG
jgi:hypothetical protein